MSDTVIIFGGQMSQVAEVLAQLRGKFKRFVVANDFIDPLPTVTADTIEKVFLPEEDSLTTAELCEIYKTDFCFTLCHPAYVNKM